MDSSVIDTLQAKKENRRHKSAAGFFMVDEALAWGKGLKEYFRTRFQALARFQTTTFLPYRGPS